MPSGSPLADLVEGYVTGQEQQQKKARELAQKEAAKFEQQYKLQQAKTDAENEAQRIKIAQQQADTQSTLAGISAKREQAQEDDRKAKNDIASRALELRRSLGNRKLTLEEQEKARQSFFKDFDALVLKMTPEAAFETTQWAQSRFKDLLQPAPSAQSEQGGVHPSILQLLHGGAQVMGADPPPVPGQMGQNMLSAPKPASETPDAVHQLSPFVAAQVATMTANAGAALSRAGLNREKEKTERENRAAQQAILKARAALSQAQRDNAIERTRHSKVMEKYQIGHIQAEVQSLHMHAAAAVKNADTQADKEKRLAAEALFDNNPGNRNGKASKALSAQLSSTRDKTVALDKAREANNEAIAAIDIKMQEPAIRDSPANMRTYQGLKNGLAAEADDLRIKYLEANSEYMDTLLAATERKVVQETTPGAHPHNQSNLESVRKQAARARKLMEEAQKERESQLPPVSANPTAAPTGSLLPHNPMGEGTHVRNPPPDQMYRDQPLRPGASHRRPTPTTHKSLSKKKQRKTKSGETYTYEKVQ